MLIKNYKKDKNYTETSTKDLTVLNSHKIRFKKAKETDISSNDNLDDDFDIIQGYDYQDDNDNKNDEEVFHSEAEFTSEEEEENEKKEKEHDIGLKEPEFERVVCKPTSDCGKGISDYFMFLFICIILSIFVFNYLFRFVF